MNALISTHFIWRLDRNRNTVSLLLDAQHIIEFDIYINIGLAH